MDQKIKKGFYPVKQSILWVLNLLALFIFTVFAPLERTLGVNIRLVYLHGAWVWAGLAAFGLAAVAGLAVLILRQRWLSRWSEALGWTGMIFWLTYLPMSLLVMRINWGGFYFAEPRWRIPLMYAEVGALLQTGLWLVRKPVISAAANFLFGVALWWSTLNLRSVLHPDSPVYQSGSLIIQFFFSGLLVLMLILMGQVAFWLVKNRRLFPQNGQTTGL